MIGFLVFLLIVPLTIWRGYALTVLWQWFMVPALGLPELRVAEAIGVALVVTYLTYHSAGSDIKDGTEEAVKRTVFQALFPLLALGFGWIVHQFI